MISLPHFEKNKDPLNTMKRIKQLGPQDITLIRDIMSEDSPYNSASNREELNKAEGETKRQDITYKGIKDRKRDLLKKD